MPRLNRDTYVTALVLGAIVVASCTSTTVSNEDEPPPPPPPDAGDCIWQSGDDMDICVPPPPPMGGMGGNAGSGVIVPCLDLGGPGCAGMGGVGAGPSGGGVGAGPSGGGGGAGPTGGGGAGPSGGGVDPGAGTGAAPTGGTGPTGGAGGMPSTTLGTIIVSAGTLARDHTIVAFPFPAGVGKELALRDPDGNQIPMDMNPVDGNAIFILNSLAANTTRTYTVLQLPAALPTAIAAAQEGGQLFIKIGTTNVFRWVLVDDNFRNRSANDVRSGYIYPLYSPMGLNVADDYASDHPHMHGVWSAWTRTTFRNHAVDFWNGYANQGHVDLTSMDGAWGGPVHAGLSANIQHDDITTTPPVTALREKWVVTIYKTHEGTQPFYTFDIDSVQTTATTDPLILEEYHYGGFGFRGAQEWSTAASYLTSEGHNRTTGDGQSARWCAQWGVINGRTAGYAGLGHPSNVRAPQGLRIHPSNPYWAFLPSTALKGGRYTIQSGTPYKSRFRVIVFDGAGDATLLNRLWNDYATPPTVQVMP